LTKKEPILVIGVNSRPIAASAYRAGYEVYVVDYWGDTDLLNIAKDILIIKDYESRFKKSNPDMLFADKLFYLSKIMLDKYAEITKIFVGSGLDDRPDLWKKLDQMGEIIGNNPKNLINIRDRSNILKVLHEKGLEIPRTKKISHLNELYTFCSEVGYPIIIRTSTASGGGRGIIKLENESDIEKKIDSINGQNDFKNLEIQEFIPGIDASITFLANNDNFEIISFNEQLIGIEKLRAPYPFAYCGNIIPLEIEEKTVQKVIEMMQIISQNFNLRGLNGLDFKIYRKEIYFMEINPRFPGTMELIELLTRKNMIIHHIDACEGKINKINLPKNKYGIKIKSHFKSFFHNFFSGVTN
jgi:hypothetical protein